MKLPRCVWLQSGTLWRFRVVANAVIIVARLDADVVANAVNVVARLAADVVARLAADVVARLAVIVVARLDADVGAHLDVIVVARNVGGVLPVHIFQIVELLLALAPENFKLNSGH